MTTCNCSCAAEAWKAGYEAGNASLPPASPELARRVAAVLRPWMEQLAPTRRPGPPVLTIAQAAERLGVSKTKIYDMIRKGELSSLELPGGAKASRRIERAELDAYIERHRVPGGPDAR